jgi:hypothetical protein
MKTTVHITIQVASDNGLPTKSFTQEHTFDHDGAGQAIFAGTVTGLEGILSQMHRHYIPTPEEKEADDANNS